MDFRCNSFKKGWEGIDDRKEEKINNNNEN